MISSARCQLLRLLLTALLLLALLSRGAMCAGRNFPDVPLDHPAYAAVPHLADRGIGKDLPARAVQLGVPAP